MNTVKTAAVAVLLCCAGFFPALRAEESSIRLLAQRKFTADNYKQVRVYCHQGFKAAAAYSPDGFDAASGGALAVTVEETPDAVPNNARIQVQIPWRGAIVEGTQYRIGFYYRTERAGSFSARAIRDQAPWPSLGGKGMSFAAAPAWKKAEMIFTATEAFNGPTRLPNLEIARLGKGNTIYLCNFTFESLD